MRLRYSAILGFAGLASLTQCQVLLNQVDTFQGGTTMSWSGGSAPTNISTGGPSGAGDRYLQISATNGHLATYCLGRWGGNFVAAGVDRIEADLRNTGANPLNVRLVFFGNNGDRWTSTATWDLPVGSGWTHVAVNLQDVNFTRVQGASTFGATISSVNRMMFRHDPGAPSAGGTGVTGQLGIDNIAAYAATSNVSPAIANIVIGFHVAGGLADLTSSDNSYFVVRQNAMRSRQDPAIHLEMSATAPPGTFASLEFLLETSTTAAPPSNLAQKIDFYNYTTNAWVEVDSRPATSTDSTVTVQVTSNVSQFINPGTRQVLARVRYFDPGNLLTRSWVVNFDLARWTFRR